MELFIQNSYRRQTVKSSERKQYLGSNLRERPFMILNESERKFFMSGIAAYMGANELPNQITRAQFESAVKVLYDTIPDSVSTEVEGLPGAPDKPLRDRLKETDDAVA